MLFYLFHWWNVFFLAAYCLFDFSPKLKCSPSNKILDLQNNDLFTVTCFALIVGAYKIFVEKIPTPIITESMLNFQRATP